MSTASINVLHIMRLSGGFIVIARIETAFTELFGGDLQELLSNQHLVIFFPGAWLEPAFGNHLWLPFVYVAFILHIYQG